MYIGPSYLGRRTKGDVVTWLFTLTVGDAPTTLGTSPAVKCYQDGSNVEFTGGITLTPDYDGKTGLCQLVVDTSDAAYSAGHFYDFVITAGAIGIVSPIGYVVGHFELIPEPSDLRAVNGGSTGAAAGKLELAQLKVIATTPGDVAIVAHGSNGVDGVVDGQAGLEIKGGNGTLVTSGGRGIDLYSGADNGMGAGFALVAAGGVEIDGLTNYPVLALYASGSGDVIKLLPDTTGKAANILGQVYVATTNAGDAGIVIDTTATGAKGVYVHAGQVGLDITSSGDSAIVLRANDDSGTEGKAIYASGQVYIAPGNTNDDALKLVPNGAGLPINPPPASPLADDTTPLPELPQGVPPTTPTPAQALMLGYMALRNQLKVHSDTLLKEVYNNAGTRIAKKAISDDGTTYVEAKMTTGA